MQIVVITVANPTLNKLKSYSAIQQTEKAMDSFLALAAHSFHQHQKVRETFDLCGRRAVRPSSRCVQLKAVTQGRH